MRPLLALSILLAAVPAAAELGLESVLEGLTQPVRLTAPAGDERLFVVEQTGRIRVFDRDGAPRGVFLDLSASISTGGERGLLGLAFAPDHAESRRFFVNFTDPDGDTRIVRYTTSAGNPDRADPASASPVLSVEQPYGNHNGGHLEFGPDGMLYVGLGDGGSAGDPENRAQAGLSLLGKMLRLDVSGDSGYAVPPDNPFVGFTAFRQEIWALGLRNPWCFGFDRETGDLAIADVGQDVIEEIHIVPGGHPGGLNFGWRLMEGSRCYEPPTDCNDGSLTLPVHEYTHGGVPFRCSISGGYVHRGTGAPALSGRYVFADFCSNQIWSLLWTESNGVTTVFEHTAELTPPGGFDSIVGIAQDGVGELYVIDRGAGRIGRLRGDATSVNTLPSPVRLERNTPNPFNPRTAILFVVPDGNRTVDLTIHDAAGRLVRRLVRRAFDAGRHVVEWDGRNDNGATAPAGVCLCRLDSGSSVQRLAMALVR